MRKPSHKKSLNEVQVEKYLELAAVAAEAEVIRLARQGLADVPDLVAFKMNMGTEWFERRSGATVRCPEEGPIAQFIDRWDRVLGMSFWSLVVTRKGVERAKRGVT